MHVLTPRNILYWLATAAIVSIAFDFETFGINAVSAAQKGAIFAIILINGFRSRGFGVAVNIPNALILIASGLATGLGNSSMTPDTLATGARALVLLMTVTAIMRGGMDFGVPFNRKLLRTIQWLPPLCVALGMAMIPFGVEIGRMEGGVFRVSGASSPAHLAMLCCAAIAASSLLFVTSERSSRPIFAGLAFILLVLTGARTALIVGLVAGAPLLSYFVRIRSTIRLVMALATMLTAPAIAYFGIERVLSRSIDSSGDLDTSGRDVAWSFFYDRYLESPWFGHGLGSVLDMRLLSTDYRVQFFHVPHNEYLRFLVDLGAVGLTLIIISQFFLFFWASKRISVRFWFLVVAVAHAIYAYFDNLYGTLQYLPYVMTIGLAIRKPRRRIGGKNKKIDKVFAQLAHVGQTVKSDGIHA